MYLQQVYQLATSELTEVLVKLPVPAVAHQWLASIGKDGTAALSQPTFADIAGKIAAAQLPVDLDQLGASLLVTANQQGGGAEPGVNFIPGDSTVAISATDVPNATRVDVRIKARQVFYGTHANRSATGNYPDGALYTETDTLTLFQWQSGAWVAISAPATLIDNHANRLANFPAANYPTGTQFFETDRLMSYVVSGGAWVLMPGGVYYNTHANIPIDLVTTDVGFEFGDTTYNHRLSWTGTGWKWAAGEEGGDYVRECLGAPTGNGWHLCDGTAGVAYLKSDGTTGTRDLPNSSGSSHFPKLGAAYSGPGITAAVVPTAGNDSGGQANVAVTGATTVAQHTHTHTISLPGDPVAEVTFIAYYRQ
jgi:hypothetical protein